MKNNYHETVLKEEAITELHVEKDSQYIDATLGNGGHSEEILKLGGRVLGIEADPEMARVAEERLKDWREQFTLAQGNFKDIDVLSRDKGISQVSGVIFDLGVTNVHLKDLQRGFSFENPEANLDMRLDPNSQAVTAADLLNVLREDQLQELFEITLDGGAAKWLSGRVMYARRDAPIKTVGEMLEICEGLKTGKHGINEATLPFLALRIAVNSELENLKAALPKAYEMLTAGGRLVVISFHSGEDRIVKDFFREKALDGAKIVTFKPVMAGEAELSVNRRARSAKMRVLEK